MPKVLIVCQSRTGNIKNGDSPFQQEAIPPWHPV